MDDNTNYTIPFVCDGRTLAKLKEVAEKEGISVGSLIEQAVEYALANMEEEDDG